MPSPPSSSDSTPIQNTITPIPASRQPVVTPSLELNEARDKFNKGEIAMVDLFRVQNKVIREYAEKGLFAEEIVVQFPLSRFTIKNGILNFDFQPTVNPAPSVDHTKIATIKNITEATEMYLKGDINVMEYRSVITDRGGGHPIDGSESFENTVAFWDATKDMRPGTEDNNKSRTGFKKDCNLNLDGMYFQGVIKKTVIGMLTMAHKGWKMKYDKDAFVYDDARLIFLDTFLKKYIDDHIPDKASYKEYQTELFYKAIDLTLGNAKEDIIYRIMLFDMINIFCDKIIFPLTREEQEHFDAWCHK